MTAPTSTRRPGGLTALAVLNFVLGAHSAAGVLGSAAMLLFVHGFLALAPGGADGPQALIEQFGVGLFWVALLANLAAAPLLIASGVGYLRQRRVLGRGVANAYALSQPVFAALLVTALPAQLRWIGALAAVGMLIYPAVTLALVNTTFRRHLTR